MQFEKNAPKSIQHWSKLAETTTYSILYIVLSKSTEKWISSNDFSDDEKLHSMNKSWLFFLLAQFSIVNILNSIVIVLTMK